MPNRLAQETSPYLLQHQDNPVDWCPWGTAALERARREDKPIFLSIGYAACHWCHVMEHESFEDPEIAALLNAWFVSIKVDREERPDLDQVYMNAVQLMTGHGGWPMSVFLTPALEPFFGGTYWPPTPRGGMPGFLQVLIAVADTWRDRRAAAVQQAAQLTAHLRQLALGESAAGRVTLDLLQSAAAKLERACDGTHGGFRSRPKFPHPMAVQFLLRMWRRTGRDGLLDMARLTLDKMARGGIYDQLGGGFARYSVDERWLVPHFEKMLYDNALLAGAYLDGFLATGDGEYARVVRETLDYELRDMLDPAGGFHGTEDADSEGEEGKFYLWTPAEVKAVLGDPAGERFCYVYDVSDGGNFEGRNILHLPKTIAQCAALKGWNPESLQAELAESRRRLRAVRDRRIRPGRDDKVLVSWNALLIDVLARAGAVLGEPTYLAAATRAAEFLLRELHGGDGRLLHTWRLGRARGTACLDDYAFLANAFVTLFEASGTGRWIDAAVRLTETVRQHFADPDAGGFFYTADDHERLIARHKEFLDSSTPSGNAMAATALLRVGRLCGCRDYVEAAQATIEASAGILQQMPSAAGQMLIAADMLLGPHRELVVTGDERAPDTVEVLGALRRRYWPNCAVVLRSPAGAPQTAHLASLFEGKQLLPPGPTLYLCENHTCQNPISGKTAILAACDRLDAG
jgi:uncharacterized protein YyaL (SSP411 family)